MKPLLADHLLDVSTLQFPVWVSPKMDGIRCLITMMGPQTRSFKPIPNHYIRGKLESAATCLDGEILTYTNGKMDPLDIVQSKVTTRSGIPEFRLHTFDYFRNPNEPFHTRLLDAERYSEGHDRVRWTEHKLVENIQEFEAAEVEYLSQGWEGMMARKYDGHYKFGRSTAKEQILLKVKRFFDSEAKVLYAYEKMHNANEATINELGYQARSSHKDNMVPMNTLGGLWCQWHNGKEFGIGTGFDANTRDYLWSMRETLLGKEVTFKFQREGPNGAPLLPVYKNLRVPGV